MFGKIPSPIIKKKEVKQKDPNEIPGKRRMVNFENEWIDCWTYERDVLIAGDKIQGPAIIEEVGSTTVLEKGYTARIDEFKNILIERDDLSV